MSKELEIEFDHAMFEVYRKAKIEAGYNATRFLQMLEDHRGLGTARILLHSATVSEGYVALWERGRLDLTVEALVISSQFRSLFTPLELEIAQKRLKEYGYSLP